MWLTERLTPDFKTIADFGKDSGTAIRRVCREFVLLCRKLELFAEAFVAIDGSKFKAVNNRDRNFTKAKLNRRLQQIDESIERYLAQIASADRQEIVVAKDKSQRLTDKISQAEERNSAAERAGRAHAQGAGPADLTDRPGCALNGDEWWWYRHGRLQRTNRRRYQASSDRRA